MVTSSATGVRIPAAVYGLASFAACIISFSIAGVTDPWNFWLYLICANVATLSLSLARDQELVPAGFPILLLAAENLGWGELCFIAASVALLRGMQRTRKPAGMGTILYSMAAVVMGTVAAHGVYDLVSRAAFSAIFPAPEIASAFVFLFNCGLAATLRWNKRIPFAEIYAQECRPLLPWFVTAAYSIYFIKCASLQSGYHPALIALPVLFALDRGYRALSAARAAHGQEIEALHHRTLETLAVAIDTRDHTTQMHLRRVRTYALEVGRVLGLTEDELRDLNVAALLHDIGKLGIPDYILLKPGALTVEEWEKMKTHPDVGAEMLSRMNYPQGVLDIVKSHHEKWDGTGYPRGLAGESIPIGARILSAVDCLDALASDRPYRSALPLSEAMKMVFAGKAKSFDPVVVTILERRHVEFEKLAWRSVGVNPADSGKLDHAGEDLTRLAANLSQTAAARPAPILDAIASARQETQLIQALAGDLSSALRLEDAISAIDRRLRQMIDYDTLALYLVRDNRLDLAGAAGEQSHLFSKRPVRLKESLSGWAAEDLTPVINGHAALESHYSNDSAIVYKLQAALAMPFEMGDRRKGVLTLYHSDRNAFGRDDVRVAQAAIPHVARAVESALKYQHAEESAVTDHLTGIANVRSLTQHLQRELNRAGREQSSLGILVCDLDGFKQVNDRFGHLKGNEVLQHVANGLRDACRDSDYLARAGGDEFVLVLPGISGELSPSQIERLRSVAVEAGWLVCGERCLSMSIGLAVYPADGSDAETLFAAADSRMYSSKKERKRAARFSSAAAVS